MRLYTESTWMLVHDIVYKCMWHERLWGESPLSLVYSLSQITSEIEDRIVTTTNKKTGTQNVKPAFDSIMWVNRNLTEQEKEEHDAAKIQAKDLHKDIMSLVLSGYNLSIKYDSYSKCYQATVIPYDPANQNYGYGLSARSADPSRALSLLVFKHYVVLQQNWGASYKKPASSFEG